MMRSGKHRWIGTLAGASMLCAAWIGWMPVAQGRVALVVGNSAYQHTRALPNPANDAADMAAKLRGLGFEVIEGRDLTGDGFYDRLRAFSGALSNASGGAAVFFYAGHGLQDDRARNFMVPVDSSLRDEWSIREMVPVDDVMKAMDGFAGLKLVVLDSCRDNPLPTDGRTLAGLTRGLAPVTLRRDSVVPEGSSGTMIVYATEPGDIAKDGEGRNSPFTSALLEHVGTSGLEIGEMLERVTATVIQRTSRAGSRQVPWVSSTKSGRFYFVPGSGPVTDAGGSAGPPPQQLRRDVQAALRAVGFDPGSIGSEWSDGARRALQAYQRVKGMPATGDPSESVLADLRRDRQQGWHNRTCRIEEGLERPGTCPEECREVRRTRRDCDTEYQTWRDTCNPPAYMFCNAYGCDYYAAAQFCESDPLGEVRGIAQQRCGRGSADDVDIACVCGPVGCICEFGVDCEYCREEPYYEKVCPERCPQRVVRQQVCECSAPEYCN